MVSISMHCQGTWNLIISVDIATIIYTCILIGCTDVQLNVVGETQDKTSTILKKNSTARWMLGSCSSLNSFEDDITYQYPAIYTERCCLGPGRHMLICYSNPPSRGWKNTYILINGHRFCDDFVTYKSFQKVLVTGTIDQHLTRGSYTI